MNVLVSGGAGFIGSNLVRCLAASGDRVRVLDNLSRGSIDNLRDANGMAELIVGDVRDADDVRGAMDQVEIIYHLAALPSEIGSVDDPVATHDVNVGGTLNVLVAARSAGVRRVVHASSSSVYGNTSTLPRCEDMQTLPVSPYGVSKLAGEAYCRAFTRVHGLETVSLRFFNVFGPRQDTASEYPAVVPGFATRLLAGESPVIFGDGRQTRDFTFVANAVQALALAAAAGSEAVGEIVNVGCGRRISILDLVRIMNEELGTMIQPIFASPRPGEVGHSVADISKAQRLFGYRPLVTVRQGLGHTLRWFGARERVPAQAVTARRE